MITILVMFIVLSCKMPEEETGMRLIKTYKGVMTNQDVQEISIPEIRGKEGTTFVHVYWAFDTSPDTWTPIADGWFDGALAQNLWVSWRYGSVYIYQGFADLYLIHVYGGE